MMEAAPRDSNASDDLSQRRHETSSSSRGHRDSDSAHSSSRGSGGGNGRPPRPSGRSRRPPSHTSSTGTGDKNLRGSVLFGRMSSTGGGGLRDTFFGGRKTADPLDASMEAEFNLTVIDERGAMPEPIAEIIGRPAITSVATWTRAGVIVTLLGLGTALGTFIATLLCPGLDGYEIDPGLVFGSFQTLVLCAIVIVTYHGVQEFQAHPNPLIVSKCIIDILLALRFLLDPWWLLLGLYETKERESCALLSGVTQFLYFASDCWYFALIVDLLKSLTNPFTSVKADRRKYTFAVIAVGATSGILTWALPGFHGFADGNYCWTHRGDHLERDFWRLNVASWTLFYDWMIVFYISGIAVLIYGVRRLRSGLKVTLETRRGMLRNGAISIMSYTGFWTIAFTWYAVSFSARTHYEADGRMTPSKVFRTYTYLLAGRGVVDYFVWFMINKPSQMTTHWLRFSSESADHKFSAQLNTALQRELIFFTIEGMTKAVQVADEDLQRRRDHSPTRVQSIGEDDSTIIGSGSVSPGSRSGGPARSPATDRTFSVLGSRATDGEVSVVVPSDTGAASADRGTPHRQSFLSRLGFGRSVDSPTSERNSTQSSKAPPVSSQQRIKFTPYKSEAFAELRSAYGIQTEDFLASFKASTKPSISEGASGAFMFFSGDKKFIVKSMAESECRFLCEIADEYVNYLITSPWSLITKFYGCFKITLYDKKFYFVVMENLFDVMSEGVAIHHRYDIKGSWVNRSYNPPRRGSKVKCRHCSLQFKYGAKKSQLKCPNVVGLHEPNVVLKDNDLRTRMRIGGEAGKELFQHLREDSYFLANLGIMDYSLLLGVTDIEFMVDPPAGARRNTVGSVATVRSGERIGGEANNTMLSTTTCSEAPSGGSFPHSESARSVDSVDAVNNDNSLSGSSTSRGTATFSVRSISHRSSDPHQVIVEPRAKTSMRKSERVFGPGYYYIGIIDILQQWNTQKKMERFWKVHVQRCDPDGLSAIEPIRYQKRFEAKLREIIAIPREYQRALRAESRHTRREPPSRSQSQPRDLGSGTPGSRHASQRRLPASPLDDADLEALRERLEGPALPSTTDTEHTEDDDDGLVDMEQGTQNPQPVFIHLDDSHRALRGGSIDLSPSSHRV